MDKELAKAFGKKHFQLKGRMLYPKILKPEFNKDKGKNQYSLVLAWSINDKAQAKQLAAIGAHLEYAKKTFFPNIPMANLQFPVKTWGVYKKKNGDNPSIVLKDCKWINMAANEDFGPTVVDQSRNEVVEAAEIYSGRNVVVDFTFWAYSNKNFGVSTNVNAVMLLAGGDKVASGGVDLDAAFNSFLGDTAEASNDSESLV